MECTYSIKSFDPKNVFQAETLLLFVANEVLLFKFIQIQGLGLQSNSWVGCCDC